MDRSYEAAIDALSSRRRAFSPNETDRSTPWRSVVPGANEQPSVRGIAPIEGMKQWLGQIGHSADDVNRLNIIHVTGTKGKGSTCAFAESLLRASGERNSFPRKTGLYTSPHLIFHEERIRINSRPISRDLFAKYVFEVLDFFPKNEDIRIPGYLQTLALVAFHAFIKEGVDATIIETHRGGEYDITNFIEQPIVTVITPVNMDHVSTLGPTIQNIAWNKSGIFKQGALAISAPQVTEVIEVLQNRANEKGVDIQFIDYDPALPTDASQLKPDVQRLNCSVALAAVRAFLARYSRNLDLSDIQRGISQFSWPGRFQLIVEGTFHWFLDGAHNEMSIPKAAEWFIESSKGPTLSSPRILIFSHSSVKRDVVSLLERLAASLKAYDIHHVLIPNPDSLKRFGAKIGSTTTAPSLNSDLPPRAEMTDTSAQRTLEVIWKRFQPKSQIHFEADTESALETARKIGAGACGMQTLITGSLYLVGAALFHLNGRQ